MNRSQIIPPYPLRTLQFSCTRITYFLDGYRKIWVKMTRVSLFQKRIIYIDGSGAKHSFIVPSDATEYLTIRGRSFSKYISMELHKFVHLIK